MLACRFCKGDVPADAVKCMHCGEWLHLPPQRDNSLGRAANRLVTFWIIWAVVVLILMLVFFFAFFLPQWRSFPHL